MQSALFTELTAGEEANLSGGNYEPPKGGHEPPKGGHEPPKGGPIYFQIGKGGDGYGGAGIVNYAPTPKKW